MVLKNNKETEIAVFCSCGCNNGVMLKLDSFDDGKTAFLSIVSNRFSTEQEGCIFRLKEKIKRIWYILRNKEYCYFEVCMNESDLQEFKDFVNKI